MAIPKVIYQTFKSANLPFIAKWQISNLKKRNPQYQYEFFDDGRIEAFLESEFESEMIEAYRKIQIGAAKADFFRYAILYKRGGVYLDIDSRIKKKLDDFILPDDVAIISQEDNNILYVQWALIYSPGHPFLKRTIDLALKNIRENKYPHDVHSMTGPLVYTRAINECLSEESTIPHRLMGVDYEGNLQFKYPMSKLLYKKGEHWKKVQQTIPVLKNQNSS